MVRLKAMAFVFDALLYAALGMSVDAVRRI